MFFLWVFLVSIWFCLFLAFRFSKLESKLSKKEHKIYLSTVFIYPILETGLQWIIYKNVIPYSWFWLNRLEHFIWAVAVLIIFLPTYTDVWKKLNGWQSLIYVIGLICLVGNLNEFFEYFLRAKDGVVNTESWAAYYWDTIYDMMMNIMGGLLGFVILRRNRKLV